MRLRKATLAALAADRRGRRRWRSSSAAATDSRRRGELEAGPRAARGLDHLAPQRRPPDQPRRRGQGRDRKLPAGAAPVRQRAAARRGHLRFSLNRVPDCVDPVKLATRDQQPDRQRPPGRRLLRLPAVLRAPTASSPSGSAPAAATRPATRPEIFYHDLRPGFYRLIVNLAQNNGATTPVPRRHQLPDPAQARATARNRAPKGKVPSAKAAGNLR